MCRSVLFSALPVSRGTLPLLRLTTGAGHRIWTAEEEEGVRLRQPHLSPLLPLPGPLNSVDLCWPPPGRAMDSAAAACARWDYVYGGARACLLYTCADGAL